MFGFKSWTEFTSKATETIKQAAEKTKEGVSTAFDKSKTAASNATEKVSKFVEDQKLQYNQVEHETDLNRRKKAKHEQIMASGHPPWFIDPNNCNDDYETEKQSEDELKLNILKLCEDENNFLYQAPSSSSVFNFKLDAALPFAQSALKYDPILPKIRFKLVPKSLSEEQFWKNYFYRVNLIRENLGTAKLDLSIIPSASTPRKQSGSKSISKSPNNDDDNNDEQKVDNDTVKQSTPSHSKSDNNELDQNNKDNLHELDELAKSNSIHKNNENGLNRKQENIETNLNDNNKLNENIKDMKESPTKPIEMNNDDDMDLNDDNDDFLADDLHIDSLSEEQTAKMKKELGIGGNNDNDDDDDDDDDVDVDNVDDLLADVNVEDVDDISDGELENMMNLESDDKH